MPSLDYAEASELLRLVVNKYYTERHSPIPGAFVKTQMVSEAAKDGAVFSERELGFRKFLEFVKTVEGVAIQGRSGSDSLLAPVSAAEILAAYATSLPRLRRDFWRAFIEFPVEGVVRLYDPEEDKIIHVEAGSPRSGIEIDAVAKDTQVQWRKTFSEEQPEPIRENLLSALASVGTGIFVEFARRLRENPSVMRAWNHYLQKQITDHVATWAAKHKVSEDRWLGSSHSMQFFRADTDVALTKPQNISQRAELYNFFDQLPEDLLQPSCATGMGPEGYAARRCVKVHLVGMPLSTHRRLEAESDGWKDAVPPPHSFHSTPFSTNEHEAFSSRELRDLRERMRHGFTHVVVPANRRWKVVQETLKYDCRVHAVRLWEPLRDVQWEDLKKTLHEVAALDEKWLAKIAPSDLRHPLLLPPTIFRPGRGIENYWSGCDVYAEDRIPKAEKLLTVVEREHRKPDNEGGRSWIDVRKLRYKFDPSRHAASSTAKSGGRDYRFCYHVVPGFHYDVRDDANKAFVIDIGGKSETVKHCNVTPWGHARKG